MTRIKIDCVRNDGHKLSYFATREIELSGTPERMLSEQQHAENFRLRTSEPGYESDWHTAGDPTLLVILAGRVEIELRSGEAKTYGAGDLFIAEDYLDNDAQKQNKENKEPLGHRARVIGSQPLTAMHIKLSKRL